LQIEKYDKKIGEAAMSKGCDCLNKYMEFQDAEMLELKGRVNELESQKESPPEPRITLDEDVSSTALVDAIKDPGGTLIGDIGKMAKEILRRRKEEGANGVQL
jgi:hypothetical protein